MGIAFPWGMTFFGDKNERISGIFFVGEGGRGLADKLMGQFPPLICMFESSLPEGKSFRYNPRTCMKYKACFFISHSLIPHR